jgi:hypothetical protein
MKNCIIILSFLSLSAFAAEESRLRVLKIFSNKREFVVQRTDSISENSELSIRLPDMSHPKKAKIKTCKAKSCLAQIEVGIFELDQKDMSAYIVSVDKYTDTKNSFYLGYGSPLGSAIRFGVRQFYQDKLTYGVIVGRIQSKSGSTELSGNTISVQGMYRIHETGDWAFNLNAELGYAFTLLEFKNSVDKTSVKENIYVAAVSAEATYHFGDRYKVGLNFGASQNGFKSSYPGTNGSFSNPFGRLLIFSEIGLHYSF